MATEPAMGLDASFAARLEPVRLQTAVEFSNGSHASGETASLVERGLYTVAAIPAFNEGIPLGSVILQAKQFVDEVVVVDDGSSDNTAYVAQLAGAKVLRHPQNSGKGRAIRTLLEWAQDHGVEALVILDGDGQHDPSEIPKVLKPILDGEADLSLGIRFGETTQMPLWRRIGKRVLDYTTAASGANVTDSQCGYRAFSRRAIHELKLTTNGFGVESEMIIMGRNAGLQIAEVPVTCRYEGVDGSTTGPIQHAAGVMMSLVKFIGERHPLFFFGVPAAGSFAGGLLLGAWVLHVMQVSGELALGYTVLTSVLVLGGLFMGLAAIILSVIPQSIQKALQRA